MTQAGTVAPAGERRASGVVRAVLWLRSHRPFVVALTVAGIATAFLLDLAIPGYAIAGFYLLPLLLAAAALPVRPAVAFGVLCLVLTIFVMVLQGRANGQNILLLWFAALAGAGLFALAHLYDRFDQLYESERSTTARLQRLTAAVRTLQEAAILDASLPPDDLLQHIAAQARQLLGSDASSLYRLDHDSREPALKAAAGASPATAGGDGSAAVRVALERALATRTAVVEPRPGAAPAADTADGRSEGRSTRDATGTCLAVPLVARDEVYGALALCYDAPRTFDDDEVRVAQAFGDQAALAIENARLREQIERSATAAERSRLARELHDSVTQSLFAASLKAEALQRSAGAVSADAGRTLDDLQRLTRGALAEMRTMLLEMRPDVLTETSLAELLRHLAEAAESRSRVRVTLSTHGRRPPLTAEVRIAFYRIAQEALNNVVRHAHASHAWIDLRSTPSSARLVVGDDGCGFDPSRPHPEHLGLRTMGERAAAAGAELRIETRRRRGTVVTVEWPSPHA